MAKVLAYIMINVEVGKTSEVFSALQRIPSAELVSVTAGEFDIIVRVSVDSLEDLFEETEKIHKIDGVAKTITLVVEKEARREE